MFRTLRAFAWLRWRVLMNSLERRGSRDVMERFSAAFEQLAPALTALLMLPSAVALAAAGGFAGWTIGRGEAGIVFGIVRFVLLAATALTVVGPILLPGSERTNAVRLLLLPIARHVLYLAQSISALTDPWVLLAAAMVMALPLGIAIAGNLPAAAVALAAGLLLLAILVGITQLVTSAVALIVRDRRRAELMTLVIVVFLPLVGMLPGLIGSGRHRARQASIERQQQEDEPRWWSGIERKAFAALPSEMYASSVGSARANLPGLGALVALLATAGALHGVAMVAFGRVLSSPGTVGGARTVAAQASSGWRIPAASPAVSAVALNQLRLALRTPRGRATLLSPVVAFGLIAVMMMRGRSDMDVGPFEFGSGLSLASFAAFVSLIAILPLAMNQFAIDRAGLTLQILVPLETAALLRGKAVGNALIASIPAGICLAGAAIFFPSGDPRMWLCIPLTLASAYLLVAPIAAILSAIFPRAVDLNSIGRNSNAHGAAGLLGMLCFAAAAAPGLTIALVTSRGFGRPALAPLALLLWITLCFAISLALFRVAEAVFDRRRENLGLISARPPS